MDMNSQVHALVTLFPRNEPPVHFIGGWMGPRAGLDEAKRKVKIPAPVGYQTPVIHIIAIHCTD
jgi:hypothetical protein